MNTINTVQQAIEKINTMDLGNIARVLELSTDDTVWEVEFNEVYSLLWNSKDNIFMLSIFESQEEQFKLDFSSEYNMWYVVDWGVERSTDSTLVELALNILSRDLCSYDAQLDEEGRWEIPCGDYGWMGYVNGQYVVGSNGTNRPHKLLNELLGFEVINANTEAYSSTLPVEDMPFIQK